MHTLLPRLFAMVLLALFVAPPAASARTTVVTAAIASAHPLATRAGQEILAAGGNAFDAAVAVSAALAVVEPHSSGIGGGGFWLLHRARDGYEVVVDGRETAPGRATANMYLGPDGKPRPDASLVGPLAAAIPGTPAALTWIAAKYGRLPLATSLAPAIRLARNGFVADPRYLEMARTREKLLQRQPEAAAIFLERGAIPDAGFRLRQPELAATLQALADGGRDGFYRGAVAEALVRAVQAGGGIWELDDLRRYRVIERAPVKIRYFDATITTAPLPSSGGLTLAQTLNILSFLPLATSSEGDRQHWIVEAWRRAYHDRARYLGDPDFVEVPVMMLASREYAAKRASSIARDAATPSSELAQDAAPIPAGASTTHFSIVDREGNRVAATLSINTPFGSGFVAGSTGVLLNNEMDDFAVAPGVPNAYGLVGSGANAIAPGKRPLSSMSPTFVEDERGILIVGTPGGSRIISMVSLAILDYLHRPDWTLATMVAAPRFHHQYLPDQVEIEPADELPSSRTDLERRGHKVVVAARRWGNMQAVHVEKASGRATAASDPRGLIGEMAWF